MDWPLDALSGELSQYFEKYNLLSDINANIRFVICNIWSVLFVAIKRIVQLHENCDA